jgi:hypothetical protein
MNKFVIACFLAVFCLNASAQHYNNFKVSVYCRAYEVMQMGDTTNYLKPKWDEISRQLKVDKVYLETHRDLHIVDQKTLDIAKKFFKDRGIEVAGGITFTISEPNRFQTFCYSNPEDRKLAKKLSEFTAKNFDEFILDDFFFTNCKDDQAIKDKGDRSWTDYRLQLMTEAAKSLIVGPAIAVYPELKVVVKFPNWYEHFQGLGFNLKDEPKIFDGIYTGTETRDAVMSAQHLQPYHGYSIIRYFENIAPGKNGGGWVDPYASKYSDRYAEQLWITLFAKAKEQTLFDFRSLSAPITQANRAPWQGQHTSFDYDEMMQHPVNYNGGEATRPTTIPRVAGYTFEKVDKFLGKLGNPIGIKSYRPYNAVGEDFLQDYLGMIGLPMDMHPEFPAEDSLILLTEEAKFDDHIVDKIKKQLTEGKTVVITSGLLKNIQDKLNDIVELRYTDKKAIVQDFTAGTFQLIHSEKPIVIPQIQYLTNDSWEIVSGINGESGWPILHEADYSKGHLYVLVIPDNFSDLYNLPEEALNKIREVMGAQLPVQIEGLSGISLYVYDNNTFIAESFLDKGTAINIVTSTAHNKITDISSGQQFMDELRKPGMSYTEKNRKEKNVYSLTIKPHSFRVFKME